MEYVFILTNSSFKGDKTDWNPDKKIYNRMNCVKTEKIPKDEMEDYDPLCLCFVKGKTDSTGRLTQKIEKIAKGQWRVSGILTNVGRPIPFSTTFKTGETFSYPQLYESGTDEPATPIVTKFIDDMDEMLTYATKLQQEYEKDIKLAEGEMVDDYETYMAEYGTNLDIPQWVTTWKSEAVVPQKDAWNQSYLKQSEYERNYWAKLKKSIQP